MKSKNYQKDKKGSQVGFVLSFVIFIFFVFFLLIIVQPSLNSSNNQNLPTNIAQKIEERSLTNVTTISISVDKNNPQTCVMLADFFPETEIGDNLKAKNENGESLSLKISSGGNDLFITKNDSDSFIKVFESDEFPVTPTDTVAPCQQLMKDSEYFVGLIKKDKYVSVSKISGFLSNYSEDYVSFKSSLGISGGSDFGFSFKYSNGTVISTVPVNVYVNIYAYEIPVQYVDSRGDVGSGFINVRTW